MIKITLLALLTILFSFSGELIAQDTLFDYCSPVPDSKMVSTETNIILRSKIILDAGIPLSGSYVSITGSKSGLHTARAYLSDDNRTMVFEPETPFLFDEKVTITFHSGLKTISGESLQPFTYSFTTQAGKVPIEALQYMMDDIPSATAPNVKAPSKGNVQMNTLGSLPADFPPITVTMYKKIPTRQLYMGDFTNKSGSTTYGYYLMHTNTDGTVLNYKKTTAGNFDFKQQPNGLLTYFDNSNFTWYVMDTNYTIVDSYREVGYTSDVHDFRMLSNGHVLLLGDDPEYVNMDTVVAGGNTHAQVFGEILQEQDQSHHVVFQWRTWDHYKITDAIGQDLTAAKIDYVHANAIELDYDNNILLSCRHMSEITKINHTTGDIIWRWGGKNNQFTFLGDTLQFSYQHALRLITNGDYTMFDNGDMRTPPYSRALEYRLDQDSLTATAVWEYRHDPDLYGNATGYVQRMDDKSTLIDWGTANPNLTMLAPDDSKLFEMTFPSGIYTYRAYMVPAAPIPLTISPIAESLTVPLKSVALDSLEIFNTSSSEVHFSVSHTHAWFIPNASSGTIPATDSTSFGFTVNTTNLLPESDYTDTITVYGYDTLNSSIEIPITLHTIGPKILVSPTSIAVTVDSGLIAYDSVKIHNVGSLPLLCELTNTAPSTQSWITCSNTVDTLAPGDSITQTIQINALAQSPGFYNTTLTVINTDSLIENVNIPLEVHVLPLPPLLAVSPAAETLFVPVRSVQSDSLKIVDAREIGARFFVSNHHSWLLPHDSSEEIPAFDSMFFHFTINTSGLQSESVYTDTITFYGYDTVHSLIGIPITLHTLGPKILVSPTAITATVDSGLIAYDSVKIYNVGSLPLLYELTNTDTSTESWLTCNTAVGALAPGDSIIQTIQINAMTQSPGLYNATLTVINTDSLTESVSIPLGVHVLPLPIVLVSISSDWNLISLPVQPLSKPHFLSSVYPYAFSYLHSYVMTDSLQPGVGYWVKFDSAQSVPVTGKLITTDSVMVNAGWNIIGPPSIECDTSMITSIPPGMITSPFFGYNGNTGYFPADTLVPGAGYWVKVNQAGSLVFNSGAHIVSKNRIRIDHSLSDSPPPPPGNSLSDRQTGIPTRFDLDQNYPNPFNPTAMIDYQLPVDARVTLKVYNVLGKVVASLVDGIESAGYKHISWNASDVASGIYFYRLQATSASNTTKTFTSVKKMVLMK